MNDIIAKMYGAGGGRPARPQQARDPNYDAAARGDTIGGIGNTAAMGEDITWSKASTGTAREGQVVNTPAGKYVVVMTDNGLALEPQEGALRGVGSTVQNITGGQHHVGINPETGDIWYQKATSIPSQFSGSMAAQQQSTSGSDFATPSFNCPSGWEDGNGVCIPNPFEGNNGTVDNGGNNGGVAEGEQTPIGGGGSSGLGLFGSGSNFTGGVSGLGYTPQQMMPVAQAPKIDYAKMLNQALAQSMFGGMI
jgi:hypothetical protein